jgi:mRNA interferase YafQ
MVTSPLRLQRLDGNVRSNGWRDCHLEPDWVLIYRTDDVSLILGCTGSHSDLSD